MALAHRSHSADSAAAHVWRIVREPFTAASWRRTAYAVLALPVGLVCVPLALLGAPTGRRQRELLRRLLGADLPAGSRTGLAHALLSPPAQPARRRRHLLRLLPRADEPALAAARR
ncbi:hypothetical protein [Streptomyces sp. NPDC049915]|uniref:hypothetical protein n=1 Tax=Streptomyces sp. NPDC049915 TaxID=3155510 RepID=UPI0034482A21